MEEITPRLRVDIRDNTHHRIIHIHDRELRHTTIRSHLRVVHRPVWFADVTIRLRVRVEVDDERDEPVFHCEGDGDVVDVWGFVREGFLGLGLYVGFG